MKRLFYVYLLIQSFFTGLIYAQTEPTGVELEFAKSWMSNTSDRSSSEDILIAAMFAQQFRPSEAVKFLSMDLNTPEYNKLRLSFLAYTCLLGVSLEFCNENSFDSQLISIDSDNLEPYLYSMLRLLESNQNDAALLALGQGNSATKSNSYYFEKLKLVREKLATAGYPEEKRNWTSELLAGALSMHALYSKLPVLCKEKSIESKQWKMQCLQLGRKIENEGDTAFQYVFGLSIQNSSLGQSASEEKERIRVLGKIEEFKMFRNLMGKKFEWWANPAIRTDSLYDDMFELGEIQAYRKAFAEPQ